MPPPEHNDDTPTTPMQQLVTQLLERHSTGVNSMLFYGSCLRSGQVFDGLVDLYIIVDSYRAFYGARWQALANWLLPPNVFYTELAIGDNTLRCKYTVISSADFQRGASRWFETYIWGRFTQPVDIIYCRDDDCRSRMLRLLNQSSVTFLNRVLPRLPAEGIVSELWRGGLRLSYGVELRAESSGRARELIDTDRSYYERRLRAIADRLKFPLEVFSDGDELRYRARVPRLHRAIARISWPLRRIQGKTLSVLRLVKALFTFDGGLDYLAWKLERHSGQQIRIPERVRRYPLIFIWGLFIHLYRRGVFR